MMVSRTRHPKIKVLVSDGKGSLVIPQKNDIGYHSSRRPSAAEELPAVTLVALPDFYRAFFSPEEYLEIAPGEEPRWASTAFLPIRSNCFARY